jgi:CBS domain-containing protein
VNTISSEKTLAEAVKQMVEKETNSLVVVDEEKKPIGIVSSYSLIRSVVPEYLTDDPVYSQFGAEGTFDKYAEKAKDKLVEEIMIKDFHSLSIDDAMIEAAAFASGDSRRILPVVDKKGKLVGAISRTCIKRALHDAIFKAKTPAPKRKS